MKFQTQHVEVHGCDNEGRIIPEPYFVCANTPEAIIKLYNQIVDDNNVRMQDRFHFKYYRENEDITFKHTLWTKKKVCAEKVLNDLNEESVYANTLPKVGAFIQVSFSTSGDIQRLVLEERHLRRMLKMAVRSNLLIEAMVNEGDKFRGRGFHIEYDINMVQEKPEEESAEQVDETAQ